MSESHYAVCPGSFDPVTKGHLDIFARAAAQFDEVTVLVTANPQKNSGLFQVAERKALIRTALNEIGLEHVRVDHWGGLLVDYTNKHNIGTIVKGLRSALDYEYELPMAQMNRHLSGVDTCFLITDPKFGYISSTLCKEVTQFGGDISQMLPPNVAEAMRQRFGEAAVLNNE
ncbi:MAG: pantetheine-phosphate adenylyltransferase [Corynebacterium sp.]|nr:pantetheine-phosphate adenylyltransferase [Corynebacterium sp.]